jgi:hypothetical protein
VRSSGNGLVEMAFTAHHGLADQQRFGRPMRSGLCEGEGGSVTRRLDDEEQRRRGGARWGGGVEERRRCGGARQGGGAEERQ